MFAPQGEEVVHIRRIRPNASRALPILESAAVFYSPTFTSLYPIYFTQKTFIPFCLVTRKKVPTAFFFPRLSKETNVLSTIVGFYTVQTIFCVVGVLQGSFCHSAHLSLCPLSPPSMNYVGGDTNERKKRAQNRIERQTDRDMG